MKKLDPHRMDRAVQLAGAFVANGDIRLAGSTREDSEAMDMLNDLITSLYERLARIEQELQRD